jgi:hypothetical protein
MVCQVAHGKLHLHITMEALGKEKVCHGGMVTGLCPLILQFNWYFSYAGTTEVQYTLYHQQDDLKPQRRSAYHQNVIHINLRFQCYRSSVIQNIRSSGKTNCLLSLHYILSIWWHALLRKHSVQQFSYCCVCIRCLSDVFIEPLPSNDRGGGGHRQLGNHISLLSFFQTRKIC